MYDLLIIGGGPAGLSAAMTARNRNLTVCVICGGAADSALYKAGRVTNYPGVPDVSGPALLETMTQQARDLGADMLRERALSAMPMGKTFGVSAGKEFVEGRALLLATGIAQRGTFPGETAFLGRGVSYCATCDGMLYRGKRAAVIGGGLGVAIAYPQAKALHEAGCEVDLIVGFRNEHLIILKDELAADCTDLTIMTDDGSNGNKGFVTQALQAKLDAGKAYDEVIAIGPLPMMKAVCDLTKPKDIKTIVSMNPIMIDGTGMCGGCRVTVGGVTKFACVDGPDFDGHQVDWAEAISRSRMFRPEEQRAMEKLHKCRLTGGVR